MKLNEKIAILRSEKNLTQQELANKLYITKSTISKWESGLQEPSLSQIKEISKTFDVKLEILLDDEIDLPKKEENKVVENKDHKEILISRHSGIYTALAEVSNKKASRFNRNHFIGMGFGGVVSLVGIILLIISSQKSDTGINEDAFPYMMAGTFIMLIGLIIIVLVFSMALKSNRPTATSVKPNCEISIYTNGLMIDEKSFFFKWSDCISASQDTTLKNTSRVGFTFWDGLDTVNKVTQYNTPVVVILKNGERIYINTDTKDEYNIINTYIIKHG